MAAADVLDRAFRPDHPASFNQNHADDQEYRRLRALGRKEADARSQCYDGAHKAYEEGNGALAHQLSEKGKLHDQAAKTYNQQAAEFVFRANNSRCAGDEIDLHGLYVEEAAQIFETRVQACQQRNEDHLHVIVGKGIHSQNHMAKLKPEIEKLCQQQQFKYFVEENEGRILVKFGQGSGQLSQGEAASFWNNRPTYPSTQQDYPGSSQQYPQQEDQQPYQQQYQVQQQGGQQGYQGGQPNNMMEEVVKQAAPVVIRKLTSCCIIL